MQKSGSTLTARPGSFDDPDVMLAISIFAEQIYVHVIILIFSKVNHDHSASSDCHDQFHNTCVLSNVIMNKSMSQILSTALVRNYSSKLILKNAHVSPFLCPMN